MKNKKILFVLAVALVGVLFFSFKSSEIGDGKYDDFAKCLTENGAKMYGSAWCGHCKEQKKNFGSSWEYINYIECEENIGDGQIPECLSAEITGYPTWEFADGSRMPGKILLQQLGSITDCPFN